MSAPYKVIALWQEFRAHGFSSLDEADAWAEKLLAEEPNASIQVSSLSFAGSWFTPRQKKSA